MLVVAATVIFEGKADAAEFAQTPRAARRNVVDEAHEVPGLRYRCAHRASRRP